MRISSSYTLFKSENKRSEPLMTSNLGPSARAPVNLTVDKLSDGNMFESLVSTKSGTNPG